MIHSMKKITIIVAVALLSGCVATTGGTASSSNDAISDAATGALICGPGAYIACKLAGGKDCEIYALGGAAVCAVWGYLNHRQKSAYQAAKSAELDVVVEEYEVGGEKKVDVVIRDSSDASFFLANSTELSPEGRQKLGEVFSPSAVALAGNDESIGVNMQYDADSDASRYLAEGRAETLRREFGGNLQNVSFGTKKWIVSDGQSVDGFISIQ